MSNNVRESKHYRYQDIEFWAKGGRIFMLDHREAEKGNADPLKAVKTMSPGDLIARAIAVRIEVGDEYPDRAAAARQLLERAVEIAKFAKRQGDPTDAKVLEFISNHKRRNRVSMTDSRMLLPTLEGIGYKFEKGDPRNTLANGVQVAPDYSLASGGMTPVEALKAIRQRG